MTKRDTTSPAQQDDPESKMDEMDDESSIGGTEGIRGVGEDEVDFDEDDTEDLEEDEEEGIR
jgi:hypothetical protein